jgi:tripartite-type tricarboxylate transporter receptor subunit TctC
MSVALLAGLTKGASAQGSLPNGPIRLLIGYTAAGPADIVARLLAQKMTERTGLTFIVESRPGASGTIATKALTGATPDGRTLLVTNMASTVMAALTFPKLSYDPKTDLAPVSLVCTFQHALAVTSSVPVANPQQFVSWLKANPAKANIAVPAIGGQSHFFALLLGKTFGVDVQVVPYKGSGPLLTDLAGGQINVAITGLGEMVPLHDAGQIRMLATSGHARAIATPKLPTFIEAGFPAAAGEGWFGVFAPVGTPRGVIAEFSSEIQAIMNLPDIRHRLVQLGMDPRGTDPAGLSDFEAREFKRWQPVVAASGFKAE